MATNVIIPSEGGDVCSIFEIAVKAGDKVNFGDFICSAETDKAVIDVTAPCDGTVLAVLCAVGDEVPAFGSVAILGSDGEDISSLLPDGVPAQNSQCEAHAKSEKEPELTKEVQGKKNVLSERIKASPRARDYAAKHNIDITGIVGTGFEGCITENDVRRTEETLSKSVENLKPTVSEEKYTVRKLSKMQKAAAQHMMDSLRDTAQFTITTHVNVDRLLNLRKRIKESGENHELQSITVNDLFCFAVSRTLLQFPRLNSVWSGDELHEYRTVNLGIAVDTEDGLVVPVVKNAQELSLSELSNKAHELAARCKAHRQSMEDISGGSFSVSNLGSFGIDTFTPILNPPQTAILGIGAPRRVNILENGQWKETKEVSLSLTLDHRAVEGAPGARFLKALCENIEDIDILLSI